MMLAWCFLELCYIDTEMILLTSRYSYVLFWVFFFFFSTYAEKKVLLET